MIPGILAGKLTIEDQAKLKIKVMIADAVDYTTSGIMTSKFVKFEYH